MAQQTIDRIVAMEEESQNSPPETIADKRQREYAAAQRAVEESDTIDIDRLDMKVAFYKALKTCTVAQLSNYITKIGTDRVPELKQGILNNACYYGNEQIIDYILSLRGNINVNIAFLHACNTDNMRIIEKIYSLKVTNFGGCLPNAVGSGNLQLVDFLLKATNVSQVDKKLALINACKSKNHKMLKFADVFATSLPMHDINDALLIIGNDVGNILGIRKLLSYGANPTCIDELVRSQMV